MVYIGIDVGGTGVQVGVVNEQGEIIAKDSFPTGVGRPYQEMIRDMADCTRSAVAKAGLTMDDVKAVGVGIPGIGDNKTGNVIFCTNLGWHDVPLRAEYQQYIDKPVYIDNDATVAGLAESVAGVSANTDSSVFLTLGTGVGGGIVIHGKVWNGFHGVGSEIGHMILKVGGEPCTCGNHGCVERYCSATDHSHGEGSRCAASRKRDPNRRKRRRECDQREGCIRCGEGGRRSCANGFPRIRLLSIASDFEHDAVP